MEILWNRKNRLFHSLFVITAKTEVGDLQSMGSHFTLKNPLNRLRLVVILMVHWEETDAAIRVRDCKVGSARRELNALTNYIFLLLRNDQRSRVEVLLKSWLVINITLIGPNYQKLSVGTKLSTGSNLFNQIVFLEIFDNLKLAGCLLVLVDNSVGRHQNNFGLIWMTSSPNHFIRNGLINNGGLS